MSCEDAYKKLSEQYSRVLFLLGMATGLADRLRQVGGEDDDSDLAQLHKEIGHVVYGLPRAEKETEK